MKYEVFLKNMKGCPFCDGKNKIIVESLEEITEVERNDIDNLQEKALEILKKLGYLSITQLVREGNGINKAVNHVHFHTIPNIRIGDLDHYGQERKILSDSDIEKTIAEIRRYA